MKAELEYSDVQSARQSGRRPDFRGIPAVWGKVEKNPCLSAW